jgi:hypothetical protein
MMESGLRSEIAKVALGYDLKFKITNELMESYLTPTYFNSESGIPNCDLWSSLASWSKFEHRKDNDWLDSNQQEVRQASSWLLSAPQAS